MAINDINEKILFQRGGKSINGVEKKTINPYLTKPDDLKRKLDEGVLVIDPNKVVNQYNEIVDRYVKQEDLVIYASLKVYKKPESAVVSSGGQIRQKESISDAININFLNPLKNEQRADRSYKNKGKFTSEWTDFFTSDSANDKKSSDFLLDPETFGITNISIKINASLLPIITIQFTDVQGRVLFERGNDKENPYNIFYTYPYPKFLLTYKGYYGKAVEIPLVLLKSNTRFDPSTGNYNVTADFQSEIFALFNTFLVIYGYVAPYMYLLDDGDYLGKKILKALYDKQNKKIKEQVGNDQYENYKIDTYPTLFDLSKALKLIPVDVINDINVTDESIDVNEKLLTNKNIIENYEFTVRGYISNSPDNYRIAQNENTFIYEPINNDYIVSVKDRTPSALFDYLDRINEAVKNISDIKTTTSQKDSFKDNLLEDIKKRANDASENALFVKYVKNQNFNIEKLLTGDVFLYNSDQTSDFKNPVFLDNFDEMVSIIFNNVSKLQAVVEEDYVTEQIEGIGKSLGYKPNLSNILRIISNNMQTFLILLDIIGKSALKQLETNAQRLNTQKKFSEYKKEYNNLIHTPFPNYYKTKPEFIGGKIVDRVTLAYPGIEAINDEWFEVNFVEEIYKALNRIKSEANPTNTGIKQSIPTGILTLFQLGETTLTPYPSKEVSRVLGELYSKHSIFSAYSGLQYRAISNFASSVSEKLANFELELIQKNVFDIMTSEQNKFVLANEIVVATSGSVTENGVTYTNLGNFGLKFIKFGDQTLDGAKSILKPIFTELSNYTTASYSESEYKASIAKLDNVLKQPVRDDGTGKLIGIGNKYIYDTITYKPSDNNINQYSVNLDAKSIELKHYIDLKPNYIYYCDLSSTLDGLSTNLQSIDTGRNSDYEYLSGTDNAYGGFYNDMNTHLSKIPISSDVSRSVNYAVSDDAPALTFNTTTDDYNKMGDYAPFKIQTITAEDGLYYNLFNI